MVSIVLFAVHKHSPNSYLLCQNEPQSGSTERCLYNRIKIFRNNKHSDENNENTMKEITPTETKLKKYRPQSVGILPAFQKYILCTSLKNNAVNS
jgi:hypothetical protein